MKVEFSGQILEKKKNLQLLNFMKTRPVGAELFHTGKETGMTNLIVAIRNFANAPKLKCIGLVRLRFPTQSSVIFSC
jgi:hypothetical protein